MANCVELKIAEKERDAIKVEKEDEIAEYYELRQLLKDKGQDFQAVITHPTYALPFLNAGGSSKSRTVTRTLVGV